MDLQNFRYFKYPQLTNNQLPAIVERTPIPIPARFLPNVAVDQRTANGVPSLIVVRTIVRPHVEQQQSTEDVGALTKLRAIFGYFGRVLFGNLPNVADVPLKFDPEAAYRLREKYQRRFGYRGEQLIELLGKGG